MLDRLREWWQARLARERAIIFAGVAALAVAGLWAYVWLPIAAERARLTAALPTLRLQVQQVTRGAAEVERLRVAGRARGAAAPQRALDETLRAAGFGDGYTGVARLGNGRNQVNLGVVSFDLLVRVLGQLADTHGLAVETLVVRAAGEPGKVRVETLVLRGPPNS